MRLLSGAKTQKLMDAEVLRLREEKQNNPWFENFSMSNNFIRDHLQDQRYPRSLFSTKLLVRIGFNNRQNHLEIKLYLLFFYERVLGKMLSDCIHRCPRRE